jgi:hypothetical protein
MLGTGADGRRIIDEVLFIALISRKTRVVERGQRWREDGVWNLERVLSAIVNVRTKGLSATPRVLSVTTSVPAMYWRDEHYNE